MEVSMLSANESTDESLNSKLNKFELIGLQVDALRLLIYREKYQFKRCTSEGYKALKETQSEYAAEYYDYLISKGPILDILEKALNEAGIRCDNFTSEVNKDENDDWSAFIFLRSPS